MGLYLQIVGYYLPRSMTELEMIVYDASLFGWFVLALGAAYVVAAQTTGRKAILAVLLGPVLQTAFPVFLVLLVEGGFYT